MREDLIVLMKRGVWLLRIDDDKLIIIKPEIKTDFKLKNRFKHTHTRITHYTLHIYAQKKKERERETCSRHLTNCSAPVPLLVRIN